MWQKKVFVTCYNDINAQNIQFRLSKSFVLRNLAQKSKLGKE